jgi:hypothetical protein
MLVSTLASRVNADVVYDVSEGTKVDVRCGVGESRAPG